MYNHLRLHIITFAFAFSANSWAASEGPVADVDAGKDFNAGLQVGMQLGAQDAKCAETAILLRLIHEKAIDDKALPFVWADVDNSILDINDDAGIKDSKAPSEILRLHALNRKRVTDFYFTVRSETGHHQADESKEKQLLSLKTDSK